MVNCDKCGYCCRVSACISIDDVAHIKENTGLEQEDFIRDVQDNNTRFLLKTKGNRCVFLKKEENSETWICSINEFKPKVCKDTFANLKTYYQCRPQRKEAYKITVKKFRE